MITAIILTYNEEKHIVRCIESLQRSVKKICIMDSFSTDNTLALALQFPNVEVLQNKFVNHAEQFNFALDTFDIKTEWIIRIDADEYIDNALSDYLSLDLYKVPHYVTGISLNRYIIFMGKLLKYGGMSRYWMLRLWRNGKGRCEQRWMDEHIVLIEGETIKARGKLVDENLNTLSWWAHKHVDYSTREAIDILINENIVDTDKCIRASIWGSAPERTRFFKSLYNKMPIFTRPFFYFIYRYFFLFGFLDGKQGFLWNLLQGFWYRTMVDAKVYEIKSLAIDGKTIKQIVKDKYNHEI